MLGVVVGLTVLVLVGLHAWARQFVLGLETTGLTNPVSWGAYIANFTFLVGVAAAAVSSYYGSRSIGQRIGAGPARIIRDIREMARVETGDVLVADMTDPDWEPVMKRASAIVTNRGGRTCHAAIIARELGIPAVVGCGDAPRKIREGQPVTVSCAEGDPGYI